MNYPVVLHKDPDSDYGVTVPDLPGCFSAGRSLDEALAMAKEAIELHLEGLIHEGQPIPHPGDIERHQQNPEFRGGTWALVAIDPAGLRVNAKRVNITIPERVLAAIDRFARQRGQTRSGFLVEAATEHMERSGRQSPSKRPAAVGEAVRRKGAVAPSTSREISRAMPEADFRSDRRQRILGILGHLLLPGGRLSVLLSRVVGGRCPRPAQASVAVDWYVRSDFFRCPILLDGSCFILLIAPGGDLSYFLWFRPNA